MLEQLDEDVRVEVGTLLVYHSGGCSVDAQDLIGFAEEEPQLILQKTAAQPGEPHDARGARGGGGVRGCTVLNDKKRTTLPAF
jgi:hypothetical protein